MKLCINCKHFNRGAFKCRHPKNMITSPVDGSEVSNELAVILRKKAELCGPEGNWFEERKEKRNDNKTV